MTDLTLLQPGSSYGDLLTTTNSGQGLPATTPVPLQDGLGNNSPITMSQTIVNITRTGGNQFQLDGVPFTASATTLNDIPALGSIQFVLNSANAGVPAGQSLGALSTGFLKNTVSGATGTLSIAVPGTDYYAPGHPTRIIDNGSSFFIGDNSGNLTLTGNENTGVGLDVLAQVTTGAGNTGLGWSALFVNQDGSNNSAFGALALAENISGSDNIAMGWSALFNNTSGSRNSGIGYLALLSNTTGTDNVAIGTRAMASNDIGAGNTAIGALALSKLTGDFISNVAIGDGAGSAQTQYNACTFIGAGADASANSLFNACAIGVGATVDTSGSIVLGRNCNIGIGTSAPASPLHVVGTIQQKGIVSGWTGTDQFRVQESIQTTDNSSHFLPLTDFLNNGTAYLVSSTFIAIDASGNGDAAVGNGSYSFVIDNGGTFDVISAPAWQISSTPGFDNVLVTWDHVLSAGVQVKGLTGKTINWVFNTIYSAVKTSIT